MERFGDAIGLAFQIADDILDLQQPPISSERRQDATWRSRRAPIRGSSALTERSSARDYWLLARVSNWN